MKKEELKFLYIIVFIILSVIIVLFFLAMKIKDDKLKEQERDNALLQQQLEIISRKKRTDPIFKEVPVAEAKKNVEMSTTSDKKYVGKWRRVSMSINGVPENFSQATLEMKESSFVKTTNCSISGSLSITESKMVMNVINDGCREGKNSFVNNYSVSSDGKQLTLSIDDPQFKMIEGYDRVFEKD